MRRLLRTWVRDSVGVLLTNADIIHEICQICDDATPWPGWELPEALSRRVDAASVESIAVEFEPEFDFPDSYPLF